MKVRRSAMAKHGLDWALIEARAGRDALGLAYERCRARDLHPTCWRDVPSIRASVIDAALTRIVQDLRDDGRVELEDAWLRAADMIGESRDAVRLRLSRDRERSRQNVA